MTRPQPPSSKDPYNEPKPCGSGQGPNSVDCTIRASDIHAPLTPPRGDPNAGLCHDCSDNLKPHHDPKKIIIHVIPMPIFTPANLKHLTDHLAGTAGVPIGYVVMSDDGSPPLFTLSLNTAAIFRWKNQDKEL